MTTVQIVGIAVASAIVLLLIIALLVTRRRAERDDAAEDTSSLAPGSFLDAPLHDTLGKLGRAEREPQEGPPQPDEAVVAPPEPGPDEAEITGELPVVQPDEPETTGEVGQSPRDESPSGPRYSPPPGEGGTPTATPAPARPAEGGSTESGAGPRGVPLSQIIVTTSDKIVDLDDPEVRRTLTDLVALEIDQATMYRQHGQTIDAVLQLTEAEKICRALGLKETAERIRQMMAELDA